MNYFKTREQRFDLFYEICAKLYDVMLDDKYYPSCESVFEAIEHKHIDIYRIL